ncbi:hypothetical protein [Flavobacterium chungangensis]|uniref:Anti-sigma-28 factor FlgM C-terminal domain-containing protein n=1 Tax=Flavobacterium chungangensis TaxID=2708132 RepID=A0ABV8ZN93_9FLAO
MDLNFIDTSQNLSDLSEKDLYKISDDQEIAIEKSRKEIEDGDFHISEKVISEMRNSLKKK